MKTPLLLISLFVMCQAIIHLIRFLWNIPMTIGSFYFPGWTGGLFFVGLGLLASWSFQAIFKSRSSSDL